VRALSKPDAAPPSPLLDKLAVLGRRHDVLRAETQRARTGEALTRTRLGEALVAALAARSRAEAAARTAVFARHLAAGRAWLRPDRRNRLRRLVERLLSRLGPWGQALVIARSGVWRTQGPGLRAVLKALPAMAAYARRGADPTAQPAAPFDQTFYLRGHADVAASGRSPLTHYLLTGGREGRAPHPLFDPAAYERQVGDGLAATGLTALEHYLRLGAPRGLSPHPLFDPAEYAVQAPELADTGESPLAHYLRIGARQGLSPHPLFQPDYYRRGAAGLAAEVNPLVHYLAHGSERGLKPHPLFDPAWYRERHPTLGRTDPLQHFVAHAGREDLEPGPWFNAARYKALRGADRPAGLDPLTDYLRGGAWAVAEPNPGFHAFAYLAAHPELADQGLTPLEHWARRSGR
jgi:hypothetical protein